MSTAPSARPQQQPDGAAAECLLCALEEAPEQTRVFADDLWAAEVPPGAEVPGWFFLRSRRHAELITGLDEAELQTLATRARDLTEAVRLVTGAEAVYFMSFGESHLHYHALVVARGAEIAAEHRGGHIVGLRPEAIDRQAALALVAPIREAYQQITDRRDSHRTPSVTA
ncbi:hypothetical protein EK0264_17370 [Epidermidibacterium keratini]|uniref:HIT domain-containing protein n=1 Tax=Epidermidibacterium keratini TaxID=1891644 RepID=A0A7L4YRU1_9ACTN|nr:hypothetical protein [Epidermidibacterium keratini]QHC01876.1 hypothetical protein EK0264_17370 [Epidermidibacterium keratini]